MNDASLAIVDLGLGNVGSVANMLRHIGWPAKLTSDPHEIATARRIVLPGVGAFDTGMRAIQSLDLASPLQEARASGAKILGICLGMQLMAEGSEEGDLPGLGWFPGRSIQFRFEDRRLPVPHMGWNRLEGDEKSENRFYFVHSFHLDGVPAPHVKATCLYGYSFPAIVQNGNVGAVQFHPEKSHRYGLSFLSDYFSSMEGPCGRA